MALIYLPYPPFYPFPPAINRGPVPLRTFKVSTTNLSTSPDGAVTDLNIDPAVFRRLPNECILLFDVVNGVPATRLDDPINVIVTGPVNTRRMPAIDAQGAVLTGTDLEEPTQQQVYLNKAQNIFRFVNFMSAEAPATEGEEVEAAQAQALSAPTSKK